MTEHIVRNPTTGKNWVTPMALGQTDATSGSSQQFEELELIRTALHARTAPESRRQRTGRQQGWLSQVMRFVPRPSCAGIITYR